MLGPLYRRDTFSAERAVATGWGAMTATESYEADCRVRGENPQHLPGGDPEAYWKLWYRLGRVIPPVGGVHDEP